MICRKVPIDDVRLLDVGYGFTIADRVAKDVQNEQPWMHVSISYDETQAVYNAAAALGGLQVARKSSMISYQMTKTNFSSRHFRLWLARFDENIAALR